MNSQNTLQTATQAAGSFYKTLLALRNTYPPDDDLGIPRLNEDAFQAAEWYRDVVLMTSRTRANKLE